MIALALARYLSTQSLVTLVEGAAGGDAFLEAVSYTHLTLPTKRIV